MNFIFSFLSFALMSGMGGVPTDSPMYGQVDSIMEFGHSDLLPHSSEVNLPPPIFK